MIIAIAQIKGLFGLLQCLAQISSKKRSPPQQGIIREL